MGQRDTLRHWRPGGNYEVEAEFSKKVREIVSQLAKVRNQMMETMCEKSLLDPDNRGVLVVETYKKDSYMIETTVSLDESVPYGQIHHKTVWES